MEEIKQAIPARLKNMAIGGHVAGAEDIIDDYYLKELSQINQEVNLEINGTGYGLKDRVSALEDLGNIMIEGDDVQIANDPNSIVEGNGKLTTANAVSYIKRAIFEKGEIILSEEETQDDYIVNTDGIVSVTGWGCKKYDISDYSSIKVTGRSVGPSFGYTLCLFFNRRDEPIAASAVCTSESIYNVDTLVEVPVGALYVRVNTDKVPERPLVVKAIAYTDDLTFYKKNESDSVIGNLGTFIGTKVIYTTPSSGSAYVPFKFKAGVKYRAIIESNETDNFTILALYKDTVNGQGQLTKEKTLDIIPSLIFVYSGKYSYIDFTALYDADYFHYFTENSRNISFTFYFAENINSAITNLEKSLYSTTEVIENKILANATTNARSVYRQLNTPLNANITYMLTFETNVNCRIFSVFFNDVSRSDAGNREDVLSDISLVAGTSYSIVFTPGHDLNWFHYYGNETTEPSDVTLTLSINASIAEVFPELKTDVVNIKNKVEAITDEILLEHEKIRVNIPNNNSLYIPFNFVKGRKYKVTLSSTLSGTLTIVYTTSDGPNGTKVIQDRFQDVALNNNSVDINFTASADANNFHVYCEDTEFSFDFQVTETSTEVGNSFDVWKGKKVIWLGTSIPFGSTGRGNEIAPSYAVLASKILGFELVNTSSPGLMIHALKGNYDATHEMLYPHIYGSSCLSTAEYQAAINENLLMIERSSNSPIPTYPATGTSVTIEETGNIKTTTVTRTSDNVVMYLIAENTSTGNMEISYYPDTSIAYQIHVYKINSDSSKIVRLTQLQNESCFPYQFNYDGIFDNGYPTTINNEIDKDRYVYYTKDGDVYVTWTVRRFISDPSASSYYLSWDKIITDGKADADLWIFDVLPNCKNFDLTDWNNFNINEWRYNDNSSFDSHRTTFLGSLLFMMDKVYEKYKAEDNNKIPRIILFIGNTLNYISGKADFERLAAVWPTTIIDITGALPTNVTTDAAKRIVGYNKIYGGGAHYTASAQELLGRVCAGKLFGITY